MKYYLVHGSLVATLLGDASGPSVTATLTFEDFVALIRARDQAGRLVPRICQAAMGGGSGSACASFPLCPEGQGADVTPAPTETCIQF
jgi:hypothetical protein